MFFVDWTARLAVVCCLIRWWLQRAGKGTGQTSRPERIWWTLGLGWFLLHVAGAFHFVHHWSHDAAYQQTARQTEALLGWSWGGGIYANYFFAVLWSLDVVHLWRTAHSPTVGRAAFWWSYAVLCYFLLIILSATFLFGPWGWKPVLLMYAVAMLLRGRGDRFAVSSDDAGPNQEGQTGNRHAPREFRKRT